MHTTGNIFKTENFKMKNTEISFYSFKQFRRLSLHIGGNGASVFSSFFHVRDNDDDYDDGESGDKGYYE